MPAPCEGAMMRELVTSAIMLVGVFGLWISSGVHREAPLVGHKGLTDDVASLEAEVALDPDNAEKLAELCGAYLERESPGFALAAIHRAPDSVRNDPMINHLWARALLYEGKASDALSKQRLVLAHCSESACSPWLLAGAMRHEAFLSAMVDSGVEDYRRDPERTIQAYRSVRGSTVAVLDLP